MIKIEMMGAANDAAVRKIFERLETGTISSGFFFSSRRRHTRCYRDWSSDVCSSDLARLAGPTCRDSGNCTHPQKPSIWGGELTSRSEERRVGKEGRSRCAPYH